MPSPITPGTGTTPVPFLQSASQVMGVPPSDPSVESTGSRPLPNDVLVVEDNYIIALDVVTILQGLGVPSIRSANSVQEARDLIAAKTPDFGLIDVNLGDDKSFEIAERLRELGVPFAFTTGYGDTYPFPKHLADTPIITKPYTIEALRDTISPEPPPAVS